MDDMVRVLVGREGGRERKREGSRREEGRIREKEE